MKIDYRCSNPIKTTKPIDYSVYKNKKLSSTNVNDSNSNINTNTNTSVNNNIKIQRINRSDEQFRQIFMKIGVVSQGSGSSYVEMENTKVLCTIHGPRATQKTELFETAKLNCELKYTTFSSTTEKIDYVENSKEKDLSLLISQSIIGSIRLEKYPKTAIDIYILVLNDDGNVLVASITAATMALADAGVEMFDMVSSCSVSCTKDNRTLIDPTTLEETIPTSSTVLVAKMPSLNEITQIIQTGELQYTNVLECVDLCIDGCDKIYSIMKQNLIDSLLQKQKQQQK
ncbi:hypothetical protein ACTFIY_008770 [Dictyostelium cf. discoideum]